MNTQVKLKLLIKISFMEYKLRNMRPLKRPAGKTLLFLAGSYDGCNEVCAIAPTIQCTEKS